MGDQGVNIYATFESRQLPSVSARAALCQLLEVYPVEHRNAVQAEEPRGSFPHVSIRVSQPPSARGGQPLTLPTLKMRCTKNGVAILTLGTGCEQFRFQPLNDRQRSVQNTVGIGPSTAGTHLKCMGLSF